MKIWSRKIEIDFFLVFFLIYNLQQSLFNEQKNNCTNHQKK